jgi:WhiB family redox-sensing transcriptional regulator
MNIDSVFAALLDIPNLRGAICRGHDELFDDYSDPVTVEWCLDSCKRCPALTPCKEWLNDLPVNLRPHGVIAGRVRRPRRNRFTAGSIAAVQS